MSTPNYGLKNDFAELVKVSARDMNRRASILDTQLPGALSAIGIGVIENGAGNSLKVVKDGNNYYVSAGAAIIESAGEADPHPVWAELAAPEPITGADNFIHVALLEAEDAGDPITEEGTAPLQIIQSSDDALPGALLLGQITGGVITDRRTFCRADRALKQILGIVADLGLDAQSRTKGTVNERIKRFENADPADPNADFNAQVAFGALKLRMDELALKLLELQGQANENTIVNIRETPSNLLINSGKLIGQSVHLDPTSAPQFIAAIDMPGNTGNAQDWNGTPAPIVRIGGNAIYDEAAEVIRA